MKSCPCHPKPVWFCVPSPAVLYCQKTSNSSTGYCKGWGIKESRDFQAIRKHLISYRSLPLLFVFSEVSQCSQHFANNKPELTDFSNQLQNAKKSRKSKSDSLCLIIKHFLTLFISHLLPTRKKIDLIQFIESFQPCNSVIPDSREFPLCVLITICRAECSGMLLRALGQGKALTWCRGDTELMFPWNST